MEWSKEENLKKYELNTSWDFNRLDSEVAAIVQSMIKAVIESHSRGVINGHLDNEENYVFKRSFMIRNGLKIPTFSCNLLQAVCNPKFESSHPECPRKEKDKMMDCLHLEFMILEVIMGGKDRDSLPADLKDLMRLINAYDSDNWTAAQLHLLGDHPSLWSAGERISFWNRVWTYKTSSSDKFDILVGRVGSELHWIKRWKTLIPTGNVPNPLERVRDEQWYSGTAQDLVRFVRNLTQHVHDRDVNNKMECKYFDRATVPNYKNPEFVAEIVSSCFPLLMIRIQYQFIKEHV